MDDVVVPAALVIFPNALSFLIVQSTGRGSACPSTSLQPPGWAFGVIWTTIYLLMGVSMAILWKKGEKHELKKVFTVLIGLNIWWLAFGPRCMPVPALISILLLLVASTAVTTGVFRQSITSGALLIPLDLWLVMASVLSVQQVVNQMT